MTYIRDEIQFLRFMYRSTLNLLVEKAQEEACQTACCQIGDHHCKRDKVNLESLIYRVKVHPRMPRMIWAHAKAGLEIYPAESQAILGALVAADYDPASWIMNQDQRLLLDLERFLRHTEGPDPVDLFQQIIFPNVTIPLLDEQYGVVDQLAAYQRYWETRPSEINSLLRLWPPKSELEEKVFSVRVPEFRELYDRAPSPE